MRCPTCRTTWGRYWTSCTTIVQARTVYGAHFNDLAFELPERDALRFAQCVLALADHLIDLRYGWPASSKSGSYWANSQQTRPLASVEAAGLRTAFATAMGRAIRPMKWFKRFSAIAVKPFFTHYTAGSKGQR